MTLEAFIDGIDGFLEKRPSEQIPFFGYYLTVDQGRASFSSKDIEQCFDSLHLPAYSNISAYLAAQKKVKRFLKCKAGGYVLSRKVSDDIGLQLGVVKRKEPSSALFPLDLFENARSYLQNTATEAALCYDNKLGNACLVMVRKLLESLIIEVFEHHSVQDRITTASGNYYSCEALIDELLKEKYLWKVSRNARAALPRIKAKGDQAAHSRYFNARLSDIDGLKDDIRLVLEELIHLIYLYYDPR